MNISTAWKLNIGFQCLMLSVLFSAHCIHFTFQTMGWQLVLYLDFLFKLSNLFLRRIFEYIYSLFINGLSTDDGTLHSIFIIWFIFWRLSIPKLNFKLRFGSKNSFWILKLLLKLGFETNTNPNLFNFRLWIIFWFFKIASINCVQFECLTSFPCGLVWLKVPALHSGQSIELYFSIYWTHLHLIIHFWNGCIDFQSFDVLRDFFFKI